MNGLQFARYSTFASYLRGNRAAYTTKTHVIGQFARPVNGHRIARTLCHKIFSDMELHDGNGKVEPLASQAISCKLCASKLTKLRSQP